jgi:hypothetical protein
MFRTGNSFSRLRPSQFELRPGQWLKRRTRAAGREAFRLAGQTEIAVILLGLFATHTGLFAGSDLAMFSPVAARLIYDGFKATYGEGLTPKDLVRTLEAILLGLVAFQPQAGHNLEQMVGEVVEFSIPQLQTGAALIFHALVQLAQGAAAVPGEIKAAYENQTPESQGRISQALIYSLFVIPAGLAYAGIRILLHRPQVIAEAEEEESAQKETDGQISSGE